MAPGEKALGGTTKKPVPILPSPGPKRWAVPWANLFLPSSPTHFGPENDPVPGPTLGPWRKS